MASLEVSLVRIRDRFSEPVGIGVLVQGDVIVTCAHVAAAALGRANYQQIIQAPKESITFDFPFSQYRSELSAQVIGWTPYRANEAGDIAILQVTAPLPSDVQPAPLTLKSNLWKKPFRAYGVPAKYPNGVWSDGEVLATEANGYFQVNNLNSIGYRLQPGFSGSPIWVDQYGAVVGILTLADTSQVFAGLVIPSRMLVEAIEEAKKPATQPAPTPTPSTKPAPSPQKPAVKPASRPTFGGLDELDEMAMSTSKPSTPPIAQVSAPTAAPPTNAVPAQNPPTLSMPPTTPPTSAAAQQISMNGVKYLGELVGLSDAEVATLDAQFRARAAHPQADNDDMRSAALFALWRRDFGTAINLLIKLLQNSQDAYLQYAIALAALGGGRPRLIDNFQLAETIQTYLFQSLRADSGQTWAAALYFYLIMDYYEPSGLRTRGLSLSDCQTIFAQGRYDANEFQALRSLSRGIDQYLKM